LPIGVIIKGIGGFYYVKTEKGIYECKARGIFRKDDITPLPGDRVEISINNEADKLANIDVILKRDSVLIRPAVANVNQIAIVVAAKSPSPDYVLLDKLLITSEIKNLKVIICVNKVDLDDKNECERIINSYYKTKYPIVQLSAILNKGYEELKELLRDKVTVFAGQSGVGKSTILNHVLDMWVMPTGKVSDKIERGKHTTRHAELIDLNFGGYVVDTPGFSSFEITDINRGELELYYPEFYEHLNKCKYNGCSHIKEPDCSIKAALDIGLISAERYERYIYLYGILEAGSVQRQQRNKKV
jgi:ribosome biogenesis GTPase / thiamine phosphate phosphatase